MNAGFRASGLLAFLLEFDNFLHAPFVGEERRRLALRRAPGRRNAPGEAGLGVEGSGKDGGTEDEPGNSGKDEDDEDSRDAFEHGVVSPRSKNSAKRLVLSSTL